MPIKYWFAIFKVRIVWGALFKFARKFALKTASMNHPLIRIKHIITKQQKIKLRTKRFFISKVCALHRWRWYSRQFCFSDNLGVKSMFFHRQPSKCLFLFVCRYTNASRISNCKPSHISLVSLFFFCFSRFRFSRFKCTEFRESRGIHTTCWITKTNKKYPLNAHYASVG